MSAPKQVTELLSKLRHGLVPAMATPLMADGATINFDVLRPLVDMLIGAGVEGLFVGGTTGEGLLLDLDQRKRLHEETMAVVNDRLPVLLHAGAHTTAATRELVEHAVQVGADGIVIITPIFYPLSDSDLFDYFLEMAQAAPEMPLFVYDIPHMAINGVTPALFRRLCSEIPNLAGVKSSRPDAQVIRQLIDVAPNDITLYAGNERIALASLALGASGLISGLATAIPEPFVRLTDAFAAGDLQTAQCEQRRINRLLDAMPAGARIGGIKLILQQRGIDVGPALPPRPTPDDPGLWNQMKELL